MLNIKGCREANAFGNEGAAASGYEGYGAVDNLSDGLNRSDRSGGDRLPDDIAESAEGGEVGNGHASGTSGAGAGAGGESDRFSSKSDGSKSERIDVNIGDGEGGYECLCEIPLTAVVFQQVGVSEQPKFTILGTTRLPRSHARTPARAHARPHARTHARTPARTYQGINEYQAVANTGIAGNKEFQHTVNDESLERLRVYYARYRLVIVWVPPTTHQPPPTTVTPPPLNSAIPLLRHPRPTMHHAPPISTAAESQAFTKHDKHNVKKEVGTTLG